MATTQAKSPLSSESEGELFEVESILGKRTRHGKVEYLVRWKGFGQNEDSWEPVKNLKGCSALIKKYSKTRSPSPGRKAKKSQVILQSQRKQDVTPRKSQRKQDVTEEYTKLKTPKTADKSDYVILHRKGAPLSAKKTVVTEEKEEVKTTERVEVKQEKHQESVVKETASQETTLNGDSTVRTSDGRREVLKMVAALAVFTLVALLLFTFIPGVGDSEMKN